LSTSTLHPTDLEPSLIGHQTYATRRFARFDAAMAFVIIIGLLTLIPSALVVPGTTGIGRPALLVSVLMCFWWLIARLHPRLALMGRQPMRWVILIFLLSELISYAIGYLRGLTAMEANNADRDMITTMAFIGVALMAADGLANWERLTLVLKAMVWCGVYMSLVALSQLTLPVNVVEYMTIPGLESHGLPPLQARGSGLRAPATTTHYLELSAALSVIFPIAVHYARFAANKALKRRYAIASVIIVIGIGTTISRTGIVAVILALAVLAPTWNWRLRYNVMMLGVTLFVGLAVAKPSIARTFYDIFAGAGNDPSITSRTERYGMVAFYFDQRPWFGRGAGTWVSPMYQYLDNQWFDTALQNGLVGCAALAALHITAIVLAVIALRRATSAADKHLCLALVAIQLEAIFMAATFDAFSFPTYAILLFVDIGLCGTVWRFTHPTRTIRTSMPARHD
jgi:polysaccharide biosynthesis protein PslJ